MSLDDIRDEFDEYVAQSEELLNEFEERVRTLRKSMEEMGTELESIDEFQDDLDTLIQEHYNIWSQMSNSSTFAREHINKNTSFPGFKEDQMDICEGMKIAPDILEDAYMAGYMYAIKEFASKLRKAMGV